MFLLFLPLIASLVLFLSVCLKKRLPVFAIGATAIGLAFLRLGVMSLKNVFSGKVYSLKLLSFLKLDGTDYFWGIYLTQTELALSAFILFIALLSLVFARGYLPFEKLGRYTMFLCALVFFVLICIASDNFFQFFAGWELSVLFAYLLLLMFHEKQAIRRAGNSFFVCHILTDIPLFCAFYMLMKQGGNFYVPPFSTHTVVAFTETQALWFMGLLVSGLTVKLMLFGSPLPAVETSRMSIPVLAFVVPAAFGGLGIYALYNAYAFVEKVHTVNLMLTGWGTITAAVGIVGALTRNDIKQLLCAVLMSQFGLVLAVFGLAGRHVAFCSYIALMLPTVGLILSAGTIIFALRGEEDLTRMGGLNEELPLLFWGMGLLSLCCLGFPGIGTFGVWQDFYAALYLIGGRWAALPFTIFSFGLSWALGRMLYYVFFAPCKVSVEKITNLRPVGPWLFVPVAITLAGAIFQEKIFEQSVLEVLTKKQSIEVLLQALIGCAGLCAALGFFHYAKQPSAFRKQAFLFFSKNLSLVPIYQAVFVRPCYALARFLWFTVGTEQATEFIPMLVQKTAEKIQLKQSGKVSGFIVASMIGLFALIAVLIGMQE